MFGVIPDEEFNKQLDSLNEPVVRSTVVSIERGRGNAREVPIELKKVISAEALAGTPAAEISKVFGVSESSISAYKKDATSTASYNTPDQDLAEHNSKVRDGIITSARSRLIGALESITPEKLADAKLKDAASVAKDMSAIIKNMEPDAARGTILNQQFIFHTPKPRGEHEFEVVVEKD